MHLKRHRAYYIRIQRRNIVYELLFTTGNKIICVLTDLTSPSKQDNVSVRARERVHLRIVLLHVGVIDHQNEDI